MSKRALKSKPKQPREKTTRREFVDPVVLTPVQVVPKVARDVAVRTRELVKRLSDDADSGSTPEKSRSRAAGNSRTR